MGGEERGSERAKTPRRGGRDKVRPTTLFYQTALYLNKFKAYVAAALSPTRSCRVGSESSYLGSAGLFFLVSPFEGGLDGECWHGKVTVGGWCKTKRVGV